MSSWYKTSWERRWRGHRWKNYIQRPLCLGERVLERPAMLWMVNIPMLLGKTVEGRSWKVLGFSRGDAVDWWWPYVKEGLKVEKSRCRWGHRSETLVKISMRWGLYPDWRIPSVCWLITLRVKRSIAWMKLRQPLFPHPVNTCYAQLSPSSFS